MKLFIFLMLLSQAVLAETVNLKITNTGYRAGKIAIAIFNNPNSFPDNSADVFVTKIVPVTNSQVSVDVELDLPVGSYAFSMFLDENNNSKLDTNFLGIPKERFGFSNNPRILTGAPDFYDCEVEIKEGKNVVSINLKKML